MVEIIDGGSVNLHCSPKASKMDIISILGESSMSYVGPLKGTRHAINQTTDIGVLIG